MPSKAFKSEKIEEIKEQVSKAKIAIVTDYKSYSVAEITDLRRQLQKENSDYTVVKNTLAKVAIQGTEYEPLAELLKDTVAVAFGYGDQVAPAKVLKEYFRKAKKGEIKGAVLDGKLFNAKEVNQLAELPSKEELYAKMLGSINSPASGLVYAINGVTTALVRAMDEVRKQKQAQA